VENQTWRAGESPHVKMIHVKSPIIQGTPWLHGTIPDICGIQESSEKGTGKHEIRTQIGGVGNSSQFR